MRLTLSIAGLTVALGLPDARWAEAVLPRFRKFTAEAEAADIEIAVLAAPPDGRPFPEEQEVKEWSDGLHFAYEHFAGHLPVAGPARLVVFQDDLAALDPVLPMVVDSFVRLALSQALAERGGLMFHAAGIAVDAEAGYVFFGPSGSGKTTVCRLSHPRYRILCDEVVAVVPGPGGDRLYGTPFNGAWGDSLPEDVPLRELFYLKQAPTTRRVPLSAPAAARALLESAVAYRREPAASVRFLDLALALADRVPVTQLEFLPKETLWETVLTPAG